MAHNLTTRTAAQLAETYFELSGKYVKPTSYTKAKLIKMIEAFGIILDDEPELAQQTDNGPIAAEGSEEADDASLAEMLELAEADDNTFGFTNCPHCGIHHSNGFTTHQDLIDQGGEPNKTHQYLCLACNGEFGPELETEFTMAEVAAAAGVSPKVARARYRAVVNDNQRTFYRFPRSDWNAILTIISPKRKAR